MGNHVVSLRMTIGQLIEGLCGKLAAILGSIGDATFFRDSDVDAVGDKLESMGWDRYGNERMFCGMTGEWIDNEIYTTPVYYQRLQKFVVEEVYSISTGPTCVLTRRMACLSVSVMSTLVIY
jgi:DNA-directed RNA polymerase beta subunit